MTAVEYSNSEVEKALDAALDMTFPASDPIAVILATPAAPPVDEWSAANVYESMRRVLLRDAREQRAIFEVRHIKDRAGEPVAITIDEWKGCVELHVVHQRDEWLTGGLPESRPIRIGPSVDRALSGDHGWALFRLAGQALFAENAVKSKRPIRELKKLSTRGDNTQRAMIRRLRKEVPQVKRKRGVHQALEIISYRAERQMLWSFISEELRRLPEAYLDSRLRAPTVEKMLQALPWLSTHYNLSSEAVVTRLHNGAQAAALRDTEEVFGGAIKKTLSLLRPVKKGVPRG